MQPLAYEKILLLLHQFKQLHAEEYQLTQLGLFGSYARQAANEHSDVDVFFETEQPNLFKTARLRQELEDVLQKPVDLVRFRKTMNPYLKARIQKEGVYV